MIRYQTMKCQVNDLLIDVVGLGDEFEVVQYDPMSHHEIVPQIYARIFDHRAWGERWDKFEGFYSDGVFLIYHKLLKFYVGFVISYVRDDLPYIAALGVMKDYRGRHLGTFLVQRVAQHYAKLGYKEVWVDIKPHSQRFEKRCVELGFKITGD